MKTTDIHSGKKYIGRGGYVYLVLNKRPTKDEWVSYRIVDGPAKKLTEGRVLLTEFAGRVVDFAPEHKHDETEPVAAGTDKGTVS